MTDWILDPDAIAAEYGSEVAYRERSIGVRDLVEGVNEEDVLRDLLRVIRPRRLLDVGAGLGVLCAWASAELGSEAVALDLSPRMVELAARAGVPAVVGDMREVPFPESSFACVVAAMCLYHVPDPAAAIGEAARVLDSDGVLFASTGPDEQPDRRDAWIALFGDPGPAVPPSSFSSENGRELLLRHFDTVDRIDCRSALVFPTRERLVRYLKALPLTRDAAESVPELTQPFRLPESTTLFRAANCGSADRA